MTHDDFPSDHLAYVAHREADESRIFSTPFEDGERMLARVQKMRSHRAEGATPIGRVQVARYELVEVYELEAPV